MKKLITVFIIFLCFYLSSNSYSYDDETVHISINNSTLINSNANEFLRNIMNFPLGIDTFTSDSRINLFLLHGGRFEDDGFRPLNHFHDPLELWGVAGGVGGVSSIAWGQGYDPIFNLYSWNWARKYFFDAVTTGAVQDHENTFRSLGQIIHLIADLSVPAHVRNDPHAFQRDPNF